MSGGPPLDVEMRGDPEACRVTADWFTATAGDVTGAADATVQARSRSEACWRGESGDAFRAKMTAAAGEVDELAVQFERAGGALREFAGELDTVRSRLDQARAVAAEAGLEVTATHVIAPAPMTPAAVDPNDPAAVAAQQAEVAAHERRVGAWNEAVETVADARERERAAHDRLVNATNTPKGVADAVNGRNLAFAGFGAAIGIPSGLGAQRDKWLKKAELHHRLAAVAGEYVRRGAGGPVPVATMRAIVAEYGDRSITEMHAALRNGSALERGLGSTAAQLLLRAPGEPLPAGIPTGVGNLGSAALKRLPVAGVFATAGQTAMEIRDGKPVDQAVTSAVLSTAAGAGFTSALLAAAPVALAGGPVTIAAVGAGIVVSMGVGYLVDHHYDDAKDVVGDVGDTVKGWFD